MIGGLFSRGVDPDVIESMGFRRMAYYFAWHKIMSEHEKEG